jgi:hypothetical protein
MAKKENVVQGNEKIVSLLNRIMEYELAGVVRYTHYSLMVFGYNRPCPPGGRTDHSPWRPSVTRHRAAAGNPQTRHRRYPARVAGA